MTRADRVDQGQTEETLAGRARLICLRAVTTTSYRQG